MTYPQHLIDWIDDELSTAEGLADHAPREWGATRDARAFAILQDLLNEESRAFCLNPRASYEESMKAGGVALLAKLGAVREQVKARMLETYCDGEI